MSYLVKTVFLILAMVGCNPPEPNQERSLFPDLVPDTKYGREGELLAIEISTAIPDPQYREDRLNPKRYDIGELAFSCVSNCQDGMIVNTESGHTQWTPSFKDAGLHLVEFQVTGRDFESRALIPFVIVDLDLPPVVDLREQEIMGKEGIPLLHNFSVVDPDGDPVEYECQGVCPRGFSVANGGRVVWTPDYDSAGTHRLTIKASSRPSLRQITIRGLSPGQDSEAIREEIEKETIDRHSYREVFFEANFQIEETARPVIFESTALLRAKEGEKFLHKIAARAPDGGKLSFRCAKDKECPRGVTVATGDTLSWVPDYDQSGIHNIAIEALVNGKVAGKKIFEIEVENTNRAPYLSGIFTLPTTNEGDLLFEALPLLDDDEDDAREYRCLRCPDGMSVIDGKLVWQVDYDAAGVHQIEVSLVDQHGLSVSASASLVVVNVNRAPYLVAAPTSLSVPAGASFHYSLQARDDDLYDRGRLSLSCVSCPVGMSVGASSGQIIWTPTFSQEGNHVAMIRVSDIAGAYTEYSVSLAVVLMDQDPRFTAGVKVSGEELTLLTFQLQAMDPDGSSVSFRCVSSCPEGLGVSAGGEVTWTPQKGQAGNWNVTFEASSAPIWNPSLRKTTTTVAELAIRKRNHAPTIVTPSDMSVFEGGHQSSEQNSATGFGLDFTLAALDMDGDQLVYSCASACPPGLSVERYTGRVVWIPDYSQAKPADAPYTGISFAVTDGTLVAKTEKIKITVKNVNRSPVISEIASQEVFENGHLSRVEAPPSGQALLFQIPAVDPDGDVMVFRCHANCPEGLLVDETSGVVSWLPTYEQARDVPADNPYSGIIFSVSDSGATSFSGPVSITVKNVNRFPRVTNVGALYQVYERGHDSDSESSDKNSPLSIQIVAFDPDGDELRYECIGNCPAGLSVGETSGVVFWRPAYCNSWEAGCVPKEPGNAAARPQTDPSLYYGPMTVKVSDFQDSSSTNAFNVYVVNVDRSPVFVEVEEQVVEEGSYGNFTVAAVDPDGDVVTHHCVNVIATTRAEDEGCRVVARTHRYPAVTGPFNFGRTEFFSLDLDTGEVRVGTSSARVGYFDAQKMNSAYLINIAHRSVPSYYPGPGKSVAQQLSLKIVNVDRPATLTQAPSQTVSEPDAVIVDMSALDYDPDSEYGEFKNAVEYVCDPTGPDGCPAGLIVQQRCNLACDYTDNPTGCPLGTVDEGAETCATKGYVRFQTTYGSAKYDDADFVLRIASRSRISPDEFSPVQYPELTETFDLRIKVKNTDRQPVWTASTAFVNPEVVTVREPCGHSAMGTAQGCVPGTEYSHAFTMTAIDPDSSFRMSEDLPSYELLGCRLTSFRVGRVGGSCPVEFPIDTVDGCLSTCPSYLAFNTETGEAIVAPKSYGDAREMNEPVYASFVAHGCPLEETGWRDGCAVAGEDDVKLVQIVIENQDRKPGSVVLGTVPGYAAPTSGSLFRNETEDYRFTVSSADPDGDDVFYYVTSSAATRARISSANANGRIVDCDRQPTCTVIVTANPDRNEVNRANSNNVIRDVTIRACSAAVGWGGSASSGSHGAPGAQARCSEGTTTPLNVAAESWSGVAQVQIRIRDVDRPPTLTLSAAATGSLTARENLDDITVRTVVADPDTYDQTRLNLSYVSGAGTGVTPTTSLASPLTSLTNNFVFDVGYNATTRASPSSNRNISFRVCYSNTPAGVVPVVGTSTCVNASVSATVQNTDRPPRLVNTSTTQSESSPVVVSYTLVDDDPEDTASVITVNVLNSNGLGTASSVSKTSSVWPSNYNLVTGGATFRNFAPTFRLCYTNHGAACTNTSGLTVRVNNVNRAPVLTSTHVGLDFGTSLVASFHEGDVFYHFNAIMTEGAVSGLVTGTDLDGDRIYARQVWMAMSSIGCDHPGTGNPYCHPGAHFGVSHGRVTPGMVTHGGSSPMRTNRRGHPPLNEGGPNDQWPGGLGGAWFYIQLYPNGVLEVHYAGGGPAARGCQPSIGHGPTWTTVYTEPPLSYEAVAGYELVDSHGAVSGEGTVTVRYTFPGFDCVNGIRQN